MKLARKYAKEKMEGDRYEIITMERSFHGRTLATLTATAQEKFHKGYSPLMPGFKYIPYNNVEAVRDAIDPKTCAMFVEPIQGEGGVNCPSKAISKHSGRSAMRKGSSHLRRGSGGNGPDGKAFCL